MLLLKLLLFTLTFYELIVDLDACSKGEKVLITRGTTSCVICSDGQYQPEDNYSQYCKACTRCNGEMGSDVKEKCTKETNTKCQCRGEFVPADRDSSTCKCDIGFGLKRGECFKCEDGYFSTDINLHCQKWKECKSGVNIKGTKTSDVICNPELKSYITTPPTSNKIVSLITRVTSHRPREGAQTQDTTTTTTTTTTTATPVHIVPSGDRGHPYHPFHPSDTGTFIGAGVVLLIFAIIGLFILTAVTCKLHNTPQPAAPKNDSLCRRPVEESGDGKLLLSNGIQRSTEVKLPSTHKSVN